MAVVLWQRLQGSSSLFRWLPHINELAKACNASKSTLIILKPQPRDENRNEERGQLHRTAPYWWRFVGHSTCSIDFMPVAKMLQRNLLCIDFAEQILPHWKLCATKCSRELQPLSHCFEMWTKYVCCVLWVVCAVFAGHCFIMGENKTEQNTLKHLCFGAACKSSLLHEEQSG